MQTATMASGSRTSVWVGRALSGLVILFMLFDAGIKLAKETHAVQGTVGLGYPASSVFGIGVLLLACVVLYIVPQTAVFGALLLTGYLGGAVASNVRVQNPLFSHTLFPVYVAILMWLGLYLREPRLRALVPFRSL